MEKKTFLLIESKCISLFHLFFFLYFHLVSVFGFLTSDLSTGQQLYYEYLTLEGSSTQPAGNIKEN